MLRAVVSPDPLDKAALARRVRAGARVPPVLVKLGELTLTNAATFSFPLVFAIVCGRTLGLHDYGIVSFYTALAGFLGMFIEFGFDWFGIREVAQDTSALPRRHRVLANITVAKLLLCAGVCVPAAVLLVLVRGAAEWPLMVASAAYLLGFACDPSWYLRALERTRLLLAVTTAARLVGIAVLLGVVTTVATVASALWAYGLVSLLTSLCGWLLLGRLGLVAWAPIELPYVARLLRGSSAIVLGNVNGALLTNGGIALLGFVGNDDMVGAANLALRVRLAAQALLLPLSQFGFVRISAAAGRDLRQVFALGRRLLFATLAAAAPIALLCIWAAPLVTFYVFKAEVPMAETLIMLMALSLPVQAVGNLFGIQSLVALGLERRYALIQVMASLAFCAVMLLCPPPQAYGWAVLLAETVVMVLSALSLMRLHAGRSA